MSSKTGDQSPARGCRKSLALPYQGVLRVLTSRMILDRASGCGGEGLRVVVEILVYHRSYRRSSFTVRDGHSIGMMEYGITDSNMDCCLSESPVGTLSVNGGNLQRNREQLQPSPAQRCAVSNDRNPQNQPRQCENQPSKGPPMALVSHEVPGLNHTVASLLSERRRSPLVLHPI